MIHIASTLHLPPDIATTTMLIVGKRGSGKSNTAVRLAEGLARAKIPFAVLDPVDVWWGLKADAHGHREGGLEVYVFGGLHGDLPLEPTAGALMADVLVEHRISAVFALRTFSNREKAQFVSAFAERLFQKNRDVLHLFCEEAHETMPQQPYKGEEEMLGRMLKLQKLGRTSGIGLTSITQRVASLNKNATTQAEVLIAHRLTGPQDRDAVVEWIKYHHVDDQKLEVLSTLPTLKTGEAWVWAPDFPESHPIGLQRAQIHKAETFDSRQTPKPGQQQREPKQLRPVDLERIKEKMASTIERVKAEDPRALRAKIAELQRQVDSLTAHHAKEPVVRPTKAVEVPVIKDRQLAKLETFCTKLTREAERHGAAAALFWGNLQQTADAILTAIKGLSARGTIQYTGPGPSLAQIREVARSLRQQQEQRPGAALPPGEEAILRALGQFRAGLDRRQLSVLTAYKRSSRDAYLQRLRTKGYVDMHGDKLEITDAGIAALGSNFTPLPVGQDLQNYWLARLPEGERKVFEILLAAYPKEVERDQISEITGYARSSRDAYLQRMKAKQIVEFSGRNVVRAVPELFD